MATVRFSNELKDNILRNASKLFDARITALDVQTVMDTHNFSELIWERCMSKHQPLIEQLPAEMFREYRNVNVKCGAVSGRFHVKFATPKVFPANNVQFGVVGPFSMDANSYSPHLTLQDFPLWEDVSTAFTDACKAMEAVREEQKEFVNGVRDVINTYSTLAPALRAWPALWDLVPERTKQKHREVVERTPRKPKSELGTDVDINRLTTAVVKSKITGGNA